MLLSYLGRILIDIVEMNEVWKGGEPQKLLSEGLKAYLIDLYKKKSFVLFPKFIKIH